MKTISINIQEPYLSFLINGEKTKEIRLNKGKFSSIQVGDILKLKNCPIQFKIINRKIYSNFKEMLKNEEVKNILPNKQNIESALNVYYKFYTKEDEKQFGVVVFELEKYRL